MRTRAASREAPVGGVYAFPRIRFLWGQAAKARTAADHLAPPGKGSLELTGRCLICWPVIERRQEVTRSRGSGKAKLRGARTWMARRGGEFSGGAFRPD